MVKLLTSSKLPAGPKGSTEPLGPRPGTFCHSIGARSALPEEQRARSTGATRTRARRTHFILGPSCEEVQITPERRPTGGIASSGGGDGHRGGQLRAFGRGPPV